MGSGQRLPGGVGACPRPLEEKASEIVLMACFKRKGGLSRSDISSETMRDQNLY
jgi:hypothetical protein